MRSSNLAVPVPASCSPVASFAATYADIVIAGQPVEIAVSSVSPDTVRITVRQIQSEGLAPIATTGALVQDEFGKPLGQYADGGIVSACSGG